jgi:hypothetical protein
MNGPTKTTAVKEMRYDDLTIDQAIDLLTKIKAKRGGVLASVGNAAHDKRLSRWVASVSMREVGELGADVINPPNR